MVDEIFLADLGDRLPVQRTLFLPVAGASAVIGQYAARRMFVRVEFQLAVAEPVQIGALALRAAKIMAADADGNDPLDVGVGKGAIDPGSAMHAAVEFDPIRMIVEMDQRRRTGLAFKRVIKQEGGDVVEIARPHETQLRGLARRRPVLDDLAAEVVKGALFAPQSNLLPGILAEILVRACKFARAHEVGLQLQRIIKMKKQQLHGLISGQRASEADRAGRAPGRSLLG